MEELKEDRVPLDAASEGDDSEEAKIEAECEEKIKRSLYWTISRGSVVHLDIGCKSILVRNRCEWLTKNDKFRSPLILVSDCVTLLCD